MKQNNKKEEEPKTYALVRACGACHLWMPATWCLLHVLVAVPDGMNVGTLTLVTLERTLVGITDICHCGSRLAFKACALGVSMPLLFLLLLLCKILPGMMRGPTDSALQKSIAVHLGASKARAASSPASIFVVGSAVDGCLGGHLGGIYPGSQCGDCDRAQAAAPARQAPGSGPPQQGQEDPTAPEAQPGKPQRQRGLGQKDSPASEQTSSVGHSSGGLAVAPASSRSLGGAAPLEPVSSRSIGGATPGHTDNREGPEGAVLGFQPITLTLGWCSVSDWQERCTPDVQGWALIPLGSGLCTEHCQAHLRK